MRKILSVLLVSLLIFSFAACGSEKNISQGSGEESTETSAQESSGKDDFSHEEDISDAQQTLENEKSDCCFHFSVDDFESGSLWKLCKPDRAAVYGRKTDG